MFRFSEYYGILVKGLRLVLIVLILTFNTSHKNIYKFLYEIFLFYYLVVSWWYLINVRTYYLHINIHGLNNYFNFLKLFLRYSFFFLFSSLEIYILSAIVAFTAAQALMTSVCALNNFYSATHLPDFGNAGLNDFCQCNQGTFTLSSIFAFTMVSVFIDCTPKIFYINVPTDVRFVTVKESWSW